MSKTQESISHHRNLTGNLQDSLRHGRSGENSNSKFKPHEIEGRSETSNFMSVQRTRYPICNSVIGLASPYISHVVLTVDVAQWCKVSDGMAGHHLQVRVRQRRALKSDALFLVRVINGPRPRREPRAAPGPANQLPQTDHIRSDMR